MNRLPFRPPVALLCACVLAACSPQQPAAPAAQARSASSRSHDAGARTMIGREVEKAVAEARAELAKENLALGSDSHIRIGGATVRSRSPRDAQGNPLPKAEVGPAGDLLIDGRPVPLQPRQRALMLEYRKQLTEVIETGMALGARGADLGIAAAGEALTHVFAGRTDDFERRVEAEARKIAAEAGRICERLPGLIAAQRAAAAAIPEFAPYATLAASDIDECRREVAESARSAPDAARRQ